MTIKYLKEHDAQYKHRVVANTEAYGHSLGGVTQDGPDLRKFTMVH